MGYCQKPLISILPESINILCVIPLVLDIFSQQLSATGLVLCNGAKMLDTILKFHMFMPNITSSWRNLYFEMSRLTGFKKPFWDLNWESNDNQLDGNHIKVDLWQELKWNYADIVDNMWEIIFRINGMQFVHITFSRIQIFKNMQFIVLYSIYDQI